MMYNGQIVPFIVYNSKSFISCVTVTYTKTDMVLWHTPLPTLYIMLRKTDTITCQSSKHDILNIGVCHNNMSIFRNMIYKMRVGVCHITCPSPATWYVECVWVCVTITCQSYIYINMIYRMRIGVCHNNISVFLNIVCVSKYHVLY